MDDGFEDTLLNSLTPALLQLLAFDRIPRPPYVGRSAAAPEAATEEAVAAAAAKASATASPPAGPAPPDPAIARLKPPPLLPLRRLRGTDAFGAAVSGKAGAGVGSRVVGPAAAAALMAYLPKSTSP